MIRRILGNPLFWIFILALSLRTYRLGTFPFGFHVDEAKVGWNALSISKTGMDDMGNRLALYYNSFGDYRPTGIFYLTIPGVAVFGRNEFAVRFPSALLGALMVIPLYLFVLEITKKRNLALFSSLFISISPWHIEVSRATSEVIISVFFALFGLYYFLKLINENKNKFLAFSFVFFVISYLLYHSIRLLTPLFIITFLIYFWEQIKKEELLKKRVIFLTGLIFLLTLVFSITPEATKRLSQVSVFNDIDVNYELGRVSSEETSPFKTIKLLIFHNKPFVYTRRFLNEYSSYLSSDFLLVSTRARPYRYITPGVGLLTFVEFFLFAIGLVQIFRKNNSSLPLVLLLLSPIPASLTTEDSPNLHRAFFMVIFVVIIEAYGFVSLSTIKIFKRKATLFVSILLVLNFIYFLHMYFDHSKLHKPLYLNVDLDASSYRNVGTKELAMQLENEMKDYDKIIVTNFPDDPYPWYAFFTGKDPKEFNNFAIKRKDGPWTYKNIVFSWDKCPSDNAFLQYKERRLLVIDSWMCADESKIKDGLPIKVVDKIQRPDGSDVYILLTRK